MAETNYISSIKASDGKTYNIKDTYARKRMTEITWSSLVSLRNSKQLIPGMQYRITDYHTTTSQADTKSANHPFDIIVTADSTNKLNEVARAIQHNGDTYFSNCNLAAWKIWYCLDNDTKRFAWADDTNGKGVIYRMIDEWNNDCPYDFKNIQFKRYKITKANSSDLVGKYLGLDESRNPGSINVDNNDSKMFYTFSYLGTFQEATEYEGIVLEDASIIGNTLASNINSPYGVLNNSIKPVINANSEGNNDIIDINSTETIQILNNIVFLTNIEDDNVYYGCSHNSFGNDCYSNSFGSYFYYNSFGNNCSYNSFGSSCYSNSFGSSCSYNSFGNRCYSNSFGNRCSSNSFGNRCSSNSFGNDCYGNKLGVNSSNNKLDAYYENNKFENGVKYVEFSGVGIAVAKVQNYHIKQGMTFTNNAKHTITAKIGLNYELTVAKQSDGTVVEYCEADLLKAISTTAITNSAKN